MRKASATAYITEKAVFATRLREAMGNRGFNHTTLSEKIKQDYGITIQRQTISQYANGQSKPNTDSLILLCGALGVPADYLLGIIGPSTLDRDLSFVCEYTGLSQNLASTLHQTEFIARILNSLCAGKRSKDFSEVDTSSALFEIASAFNQLDKASALALIEAKRDDTSYSSVEVAKERLEAALLRFTRTLERAADELYSVNQILKSLSDREYREFGSEALAYLTKAQEQEAPNGEHQED